MDHMYGQMVEAVKQWDPFGYGADFYETEAVDVVQLITAFDEADYIAKKIQHVYFMSFEEIIPVESCFTLAQKLLSMKHMGSCM